MAWVVQYDPATTIVEVIYTGYVTGQDLEAAATERIRLQAEHGTLLVLTDASQIEHLAAGIFDAHRLPERVYDSAKANRATCLALLPPRTEEARRTASHYENACVNRGWRVQIFEDRQQAIAWLLEARSTNRANAVGEK